jgi:hypothetical protein
MLVSAVIGGFGYVAFKYAGKPWQFQPQNGITSDNIDYIVFMLGFATAAAVSLGESLLLCVAYFTGRRIASRYTGVR